MTGEENACFLYCCLQMMEGEESIDVDDMLKIIITDLSERYKFRKSLRNGTAKLIMEELIELDDVGISSLSFVKLSDRAMEHLMEADEAILKKTFIPKFTELLIPAKIAERKLLYSKELQQQINLLQKLLQPEQMKPHNCG